MSVSPVPRAIAHIALSVPNLEQAIEWYRDVLGFRPMTAPSDIVIADGGHVADICLDIFGPQIAKLRMAHLATANGTAVELFEFVDPPYTRPENNFDPYRGGAFHFAVVDPDVEGLVERIAATGGRRRSKVWTVLPGQPYKAVYCEDPFGNIIEVFSHNHESTFANQ
jgi:catechol 2,3-dioxygenase-like lactoylglutathione lyase family enzyme